jgi:DNA helicase-2/ATP-dependent DNA helicase PcrA
VEISRALDRPDPTDDQAAVIEAPVGPMLVVAGAGSGKTETMAARVVWLVANGLAESEEILGLTFTRKAAGELADRIRSRLRTLHRRGLYRREQQPSDEPQSPTVATYHSYAAAVLRDHGLRIGVEPGSRLLTEAGAWQLAEDVVQRWDGDMSAVESVPSTVTGAVLTLAAECAEHLVEPVRVGDFLTDLFDRVRRLPRKPDDPGPGQPYSAVKKQLARLSSRSCLIPLVQEYLRVKRDREVLDFGDQVALAARLADQVPQVGAIERKQSPIVLLDEYQDTSHAQLVLLRGLFGGGHPVTAVGDPHQSIYGWRGASVENLHRFAEQFRSADSGRAPVRFLPTSWRNDRAVLAAANRVSAPLRNIPDRTVAETSASVPELGERPQAGPGQVDLAWADRVETEAATVAEAIAEEWNALHRPTAAVLCRNRAQFPLVEAALRARGLPVQVVGLGGLLSVPEIVDLRAFLETVHDPGRGDSLMRLLTGPVLSLGPRDLDGLAAWARHRHAELWSPVPAAEDPGGGTGSGPARDLLDEASLIETLDDLPPASWEGSRGQRLSAVGRNRLQRLALLLRDLRGRTRLPLPDLIVEAERALLLDIEVAAVPGVRPAVARAHLDAFLQVATAFSDTGDGAGLGAFLGWLSAADHRERGLDSPVSEVRDDAVHVLTVHAAKGLEWDVVAVTGLVEGVFPNKRSARTTADKDSGWLGDLGALPYPLRGDRAGLPHWSVESAASQKDVDVALTEFGSRCGAHLVAEERRLGYVAFTRARRRLLLTGAIWGDGASPREPSRFLREVAELVGTVPGINTLAWADPVEEGESNPRTVEPERADWPRELRDDRYRALSEAADLVRREGDRQGDRQGEPDSSRWSRELAVLLAERDAQAHREIHVQLPGHLSASRLVDLARDPVALAHTLRRPVPSQPNPAARRGSDFHTWLERRFGATALVEFDDLPGAADDLPGAADDLPGDADDTAGDAAGAGVDDAGSGSDLAALRERFLASEWADRVPVAVEVAVETPIDGIVLRGRIDAVFADRTADGPRWDVVDWKTGAGPGSAREARIRSVQLAIYRLAWARLHGVDPDRVSAAFFYAASGRTVRPVDLLDEEGLVHLIRQVPER